MSMKCWYGEDKIAIFKDWIYTFSQLSIDGTDNQDHVSLKKDFQRFWDFSLNRKKWINPYQSSFACSIPIQIDVIIHNDVELKR